MSYDKTRLANFGRNVAADYARWTKSSSRMMEEIDQAKAAGLNPEQIVKALLGRCAGRDQMINVLAVLSAMVQMERFGDQTDDYEKVLQNGVLPRRI